jgi:hypothetical protein
VPVHSPFCEPLNYLDLIPFQILICALEMKRDIRWSIYGNTESFEFFCKEAIPEFHLKAEVHEEVKEGFRIVRKLLEHSYFEYQFYDEAASKALVILEMALRIRYKEIKGDPGKKTLTPLIRWFYSNNYLEVNNEYFIEQIKDVRNHLTHLHQNSIAGPIKRQLIINAANLVNDIYENPELRIERALKQKQMQEALHTMKSKGMFLKHENEGHLIFEAWPAFTNNKFTPSVTYFYAKPIFHIPENWFENRGEIHDSPTFLIEATSVEYANNKLTLHDRENKSYELSDIETAEDQKTFDNWSQLFDAYSNQTGERFSINTSMGKTFLQHLSDFHKMA